MLQLTLAWNEHTTGFRPQAGLDERAGLLAAGGACRLPA